MRQIGYFMITFILTICLGGCKSLGDKTSWVETKSELVGLWSSSKITYPNDPLFRDKTPDNRPGIATIHFREDGKYTFNCEDTNVSGTYHVNEQGLLLTNEKDSEDIICRFN
ncbi:MAG: hypothetical protein IMF18_00220, partial [Proteobacteria bacterium]|nr:hypothetical protein [Pseudomonadota bacterium]